MRQISAISLSLIIFVATITYALNISVNTNSRVEFGQGVVLTSSCDRYLTVTMTREIDAATATYYLKDFTLGDISTQLHSKRVTLSLRSNGSDSSLSTSDLYFDIDSQGTGFTSPLSHTDVIDYTTLGGGNAQEVGASSITFLSVRAQDGSRILADSINTVILETSGSGGCTAPVINCANGGTCAVGDTGPGGGTVIYVSATPITLRGQGRTVTRIELAPNNWGGVTYTKDPNLEMCQGYNGGGPLWTGAKPGGWLGYENVVLRTGLGEGLDNTNRLLSYNTSNVSCALTSQAASVARSYSGGGLSDWFLPSRDELNIVCRYANTLDMTSSSICTAGTVRGGFSDTENPSWWSSSIYSNQLQYTIKIKNATGSYGINITQSSKASVRPIRMF